jgi:hypothetical protein
MASRRPGGKQQVRGPLFFSRTEDRCPSLTLRALNRGCVHGTGRAAVRQPALGTRERGEGEAMAGSHGTLTPCRSPTLPDSNAA